MLRRTHDLILAEERRAAGLRHLTQTTLNERAAYRRGFNDHARTQAMWEATNGGAEVHVHYIQHGDGTNP